MGRGPGVQTEVWSVDTGAESLAWAQVPAGKRIRGQGQQEQGGKVKLAAGT